jgi:cerevisin
MKVSNLIYFTLLALTEAHDNRYIIRFKKEQRTSFQSHIASVTDLFTQRNSNNTVLHEYDSVLTGMAAKLDAATLEKVKTLSNVELVEEDGIAHGGAVQNGAPWGLARVSHRGKLDSSNNAQYLYDPNAGAGVTVYVMDTGIKIGHVDFEGRATWGANFVSGAPNYDDHGHGTHCAGTVGSKTYGVAKKVNLVAVKVLNSNNQGAWSDIIAGFNWVAKNAKGNKNVISISIGGDKNTSVDQALNDAYAAGILVVVAAMNDNKDACQVSPGSADSSFTVGATDVNDQKASFSNWGKCVDILAPGVNVLSTGTASETASRVMSGTSMATPHIAGLAATLLSQGTTFANLKTALTNLGTKNAISGFNSDTKNILGFNGYSN